MVYSDNLKRASIRKKLVKIKNASNVVIAIM